MRERWSDWNWKSHIIRWVSKDGADFELWCGLKIPGQMIHNAPNPCGEVCDVCATKHANRNDQSVKLANAYTNKLAGRRRR